MSLKSFFFTEPADIGHQGEIIAENFLKKNGYVTQRNTQLSGSTDIEATSLQNKYLVQVKTGKYPNQPPEMSSDEIKNIKSRATKIGFIATCLSLVIDKNGCLIGQIAWKVL